MDWLKRNWVDVLMGGLIFAIAAGVLVVLLRGGLFVSNNNTAVSNVPSSTVPQAATTAPTTNTTNQAQTKPIPQTTIQPVQSQSKPTVVPRPTKNLVVPEIPQAPLATDATTNTTKTVLPTAAAKSATVTIPRTTTQSASAATPNASSAAAVVSAKPTLQKPTVQKPQTKTAKTTYTRADFLRNYRVAAGSYSRLERAAQAAKQLRARGLPAQYFSSGNTYVVVVGPYGKESAARAAFARVRQTFPDAILYRPDGSREAVANKPANPPQTGGGGGRVVLAAETAYLQIGAFKNIKSAAALLDRLKNAGFKPLTKNVSGLLRVLVGPFASDQINSNLQTLKDQGFSAFPITL